MRLEDEHSQNPVEELEQLLGEGWEVTKEGNRFVCAKDGQIYHTSGVYLGNVYRSTILAIAFGAKKSYGNRWG